MNNKMKMNKNEQTAGYIHKKMNSLIKVVPYKVWMSQMKLPVYESLDTFLAETLNVQRDHSLWQGQEPPTGLQVAEGVRPG